MHHYPLPRLVHSAVDIAKQIRWQLLLTINLLLMAQDLQHFQKLPASQ
jgi:hypothetical protein